jgi:hypothetical protein
MKTKAWQVHGLWPRRVIERAQNVGNPSRILHAEPAPVSGREADDAPALDVHQFDGSSPSSGNPDLLRDVQSTTFGPPILNGAPKGIRTPDPEIRSLYQLFDC